MAVQVDTARVGGLLQAIADGTGETRKSLVDDLVVYLHGIEAIEVWGRKFARSFGRLDDWEDIVSVGVEGMLRRLHSVDEVLLAKIENPVAWLYYSMKSDVQRWVDSPEVTFASRMSGASRRHRQAMSAAAELRERLGRDPEPAEVVEYANTKARAVRQDAEKSGAIITLDDVNGALLRPLSLDYRPAGTDGGEGYNDGFGNPVDDVEIQVEASLAVDGLLRTAERVYASDPEPVKDAIRAWVQLVMDGETPTSRRLARLMGVTVPRASTLLEKVNELLDDTRAAVA